jgi:uncharacterized protein (DUF1501 family)
MTAFSRRSLLSTSLLSSVGLLLDARLGHAQAAEAARGGNVLVCVFLRGAADGLSLVVPHADDNYYRLRPTIAIPRPGQRGGVIDLDGHFGLHPRLKPLKAAWDSGQLALVHAVGSPHPTRSHFEAQDYMETAAVGDRSVTHGWLGRYFASQRPATASSLRAVAVSSRAPLALRGYRDAVVTPSLKDFKLSASDALEPVLAQGFQRLYAGESPGLAERAGQRALDASQLVRRALRKQKNSARYPKGTQDFGDIAKLIKADIGVETAWLDVGGWDTHRQQGSSENGELPRQLERLGGALAAFRADLGAHFERVTVVVMSEFGRTARENGSGGTDHGHGNVMLVLGGQVKGGRVLGSLPGLTDDQLHENRDVPVTTDFRDVLAELVERQWGLKDASPLFPGYKLEAARRLGLFA